MWFQAMAMGPVAAGAPMGTTWRTACGSLQRDLEADHAAQGPAGHEREPLDAEAVGEPPDGPGLVARGRLGEGGAPGPPVAGFVEVGPVDPYRPPRRFAHRTPTRVVSKARPGPMSGAHQSPAASAEPVSAWMTSTCGASGPGPSCR